MLKIKSRTKYKNNMQGRASIKNKRYILTNRGSISMSGMAKIIFIASSKSRITNLMRLNKQINIITNTIEKTVNIIPKPLSTGLFASSAFPYAHLK